MKKLSLMLSALCWLTIFLSGRLSARENAPVQGPNPNVVDEIFNMSPEELLNLPTRLTTGGDQGWLDTPGAAYLITQEEMRHSGHTHLAEQLRMVPGLMVSRQSSNSWAISTPSFEHDFADMQLVLQDGRELYSPSFGGVFSDVADLPGKEWSHPIGKW